MTFVKNTLPRERQLRCLKSCPLFAEIPDDGLSFVLENSAYVQFCRGDILNNEGDIFKYCPLLISGQIEVFRYSYLGDEKNFGIFVPGNIVAIAAVFMPHNRYPMNLRAKTSGEALLLDKRDILQQCHRYPVMMEQLLTHFSLKLYENINHIDWLTSSSAEQRLAAYLLDLRNCQRSDLVMLPLSRRQLAARLGICYETLSRLISGWRLKGFIGVDKNSVRIKDKDYLNQLAIPAQRPF